MRQILFFHINYNLELPDLVNISEDIITLNKYILAIIFLVKIVILLLRNVVTFYLQSSPTMQ